MMKFDRAAVKVDGRTQRHTAIFADGGLPEVVQWVAATPRSWHDQASVNENSSKRWDMNTDWNASLEMAKTGWSEGRARSRQPHCRCGTIRDARSSLALRRGWRTTGRWSLLRGQPYGYAPQG